MKPEKVARDERIRKASRSRREQEKEELRQTIVKAAGELFLEQGSDPSRVRVSLIFQEHGSSRSVWLFLKLRSDGRVFRFG